MSRAVILAGGRGTRLHPFNVVLPKLLLPIGDQPVLEIIVRQLLVPPISTMGSGRTGVSWASRIPTPPAKMTIFILCHPEGSGFVYRKPQQLIYDVSLSRQQTRTRQSHNFILIDFRQRACGCRYVGGGAAADFKLRSPNQLA